MSNVFNHDLGRQSSILLCLLAIFICLLNASKPVHIDDTYYLWLARHISENPLDPFGFEIFWQQWPMKAYDNYVPPLFPYWLAMAMTVTGDNPYLIKLALLPFILMFVFSVHALSSRFSPAFAMPITLFLALAPAVLPA